MEEALPEEPGVPSREHSRDLFPVADPMPLAADPGGLATAVSAMILV